MPPNRLTPEQEQVITHPTEYHAKVLAVAGSGKSTTMAHRIRYLILDKHVSPKAIRVLMFNALARKQFLQHLEKAGLPQELHPDVHTFHSFSFQLIHEAIKANLLSPGTKFWLSDKAEFIWMILKRGIADLEKARRIPPDAIDAEQALQAISLWKGALIPPHRAGSMFSPNLPLIYQKFEEFRETENALTYDDFIPLANDLLESNPHFSRRFVGNLEHLIIDEYQDINLGQQTLIELLAGERADVMVVGDDDQTIYEWRGARPNYILKDFELVFNGKPIRQYQLSRSFRFGPLIAQCASNTIACNTTRVEKPLVAFQAGKAGFIQLYLEAEATRELAEQVQTLLQSREAPPTQIVVLARMYAQLDNLEAEFLARKIPYRVDGQEPFFRRKEINTLLDYIRLASQMSQSLSEQSGDWLLSVANKPSRMLPRSLLERLIQISRQRRWSVQAGLEWAERDPSSGIPHWQTRSIQDLLEFLIQLRSRLNQPEAATVLEWMVRELNYLPYFEQYYGKGETSDEKSNSVQHFIELVRQMKATPLGLVGQLASLDTTQGKPEEQQILFTTIYRTKGLEYDFVVIPQCEENLMPYLRGRPLDVFDTRAIHKATVRSDSLENERRLFYVALTRARKGVFIGASGNPSRFIHELQLQPTRGVMSCVETLASGEGNARLDLFSILQNDGHNPILWKNLIEGYLPDLGEQAMAIDLIRHGSMEFPSLGIPRKGDDWLE